MRLAVSSSDTKQNCFQGVYYTRIGLIPAEVRSNWHKHESFDFIIDKATHKLLKEIAENTLFFKNLSEATDVFISTAFNDNKKSTLEKGYFHAIFREPTDKKAVTEINIQSTGLSEETIFEKVKKIV
ncbi:hypothetical protein IJD34_08530, partial [bacterium]|nr:hypothetical protein [bacterium]